MQGRLVKHVLAWECARVVSGDGGTDSGVGMEWRKAQRNVEADVEANALGQRNFALVLLCIFCCQKHETKFCIGLVVHFLLPKT